MTKFKIKYGDFGIKKSRFYIKVLVRFFTIFQYLDADLLCLKELNQN